MLAGEALPQMKIDLNLGGKSLGTHEMDREGAVILTLDGDVSEEQVKRGLRGKAEDGATFVVQYVVTVEAVAIGARSVATTVHAQLKKS